jgi:hypothetical protein
MTEFQPDQPLSVTLTAVEWNAVAAGIRELPMRIAQPLMQRIMEQIELQHPGAAAPNGADDHPPELMPPLPPPPRASQGRNKRNGN